MMRNARLPILFILLMAGFAPIFAQSMTNTSEDAISFKLRFYNKKVYYPGDSVLLKATIRNDSSSDYAFKLADDPILNMEITVKTLANMALPSSEIYEARRVEHHPVFYRIVTIKPNEEHSFVIDLKQFVTITDANDYFVVGSFNPNMTGAISDEILMAPSLRLSVRPADLNDAFTEKIDEKTGEILRRESLSPDMIIASTLEARQKGQWEKFFLYMDIESLYKRNFDRTRRYNNAGPIERASMLNDYKKKFVNETVEDADLVNIPFEYKILSVYYTENEAKVIAREVFKKKQFNEVKEYSWRLRKSDGIWVIYGYDVKNLGNT